VSHTVAVDNPVHADNTGLFIPAWDGNPDVGTIDDRTGLATYTGDTEFSSGSHTIEDRKIVDTITMDSESTANLTVRNCWINGSGNWGIIQDGSGSLTMEDCYCSPSAGPTEWIAVTGQNLTIRRVKFDPGEDAIRLSSNSLIEQCHVLGPNDALTYGDAIQSTGGDGMVISYCYLKNTMQTGQPGAGNAAIIATNDATQVNDLLIEHSVLEGGANGVLQINRKTTCPTSIQLNDVIMDDLDGGTFVNIGDCDTGSNVTQWDNVREQDGTPIPNPDP